MPSNLNPTFFQQVNPPNESIGAVSAFNFLIARVTHIVQGPTLVGTNIPDPYYTDPTSLGLVEFQLIKEQSRTPEAGGNLVARPMFSSIKQYPIEGEIVLIVPGPSSNMNEGKAVRDYYYILTYNLWNDNHHNAFPDLGDYGNYVSKIKRTFEESLTDYQATNVSDTGSLTMPLGPNFFEKSNIRTLKQFTGDVTVEGRWGNSIRLGSNNPVPVDQNPWSKTQVIDGKIHPEPGNPIIIIRNGQGKQSNNVPWIPTVENINADPTSIYLTQGQEIVIDDINNNFSLASLQITLTRTYTLSVPIQQQLTSTDNIAATAQDESTLRGVS